MLAIPVYRIQNKKKFDVMDLNINKSCVCCTIDSSSIARYQGSERKKKIFKNTENDSQSEEVNERHSKRKMVSEVNIMRERTKSVEVSKNTRTYRCPTKN